MSLKKRTKNKKREELWGKQCFLSKCVTILAASSSGFLFTELCFHAEITTYPTPKFQMQHWPIMSRLCTWTLLIWVKGAGPHHIRDKMQTYSLLRVLAYTFQMLGLQVPTFFMIKICVSIYGTKIMGLIITFSIYNVLWLSSTPISLY
jgi:hypothetical protein